MKTIELSDQDLSLIASALGAMPYAQVAPLIANIQEQINEQSERPASERTSIAEMTAELRKIIDSEVPEVAHGSASTGASAE